MKQGKLAQRKHLVITLHLSNTTDKRKFKYHYLRAIGCSTQAARQRRDSSWMNIKRFVAKGLRG